MSLKGTYLRNFIKEQQKLEREQRNGGIAVHGVSINNLKFADDIDLIEASSSSLPEVAQLLNEHGKRLGLVINKAKTQTVVFGNNNADQPIKINDRNDSSPSSKRFGTADEFERHRFEKLY